MDTICHTILDVLTSADAQSIPELMNVVHPRPRAWRDIMVDINEALRPENPLPLVPLVQWVSQVEALSTNPTKRDLENTVCFLAILLLQQRLTQMR